jgi:hypothetical protein
MTKEQFCRREPVFKRLNSGVTPVTVSFSLSFQDVPNAGANNCSDTYTQKNYANAARSRTIQESAYGAFQLGGDVLRSSSEVPHGTGNPPHTLHSGGGVPRCFQPDINQQCAGIEVLPNYDDNLSQS